MGKRSLQERVGKALNDPAERVDMSGADFRKQLESLLSLADVRIGRDRLWDIQVHDDDFYERVMSRGSLGLGESYVEGQWDCGGLDEFFYRVLRVRLDERVQSAKGYWAALRARLFNLQKPSQAYHIGRHHYDRGNGLYRAMLDRRMIYSCGYWANAATLDDAQEAKLDLVCRKLNVQPGMRVLDIGCGWGGTARYAAERYGAEVVGITVSEQQARFAQELCRGLPVEIRLQDYRRLKGSFDRILSIGMFEHVGEKNYRTFMRIVSGCLNENGLFLLHTIGRNRSVRDCDPWMARYIFPNSMLPSARQICSAGEGLFVLEDWHGFGLDYDRTLRQWFRNFHDHWAEIKKDYDERFYRMWKYYLLSCAGAFRARRQQVWQIVFSKNGAPGGYTSVR